ncbi:hypothetical protein KCU65_g5251, partial [Aureobasidium melanogenum]
MARSRKSWEVGPDGCTFTFLQVATICFTLDEVRLAAPEQVLKQRQINALHVPLTVSDPSIGSHIVNINIEQSSLLRHDYRRPFHIKVDLAKRWNMKEQSALTPRFAVVRRLSVFVLARSNTVPNSARRPSFYPQELRKHKHYLPSDAITLTLRRTSNNLKRSLQKPPVARP